MEKNISEAAIQGNVTSLMEILQEDPLVLDKIIVSCISETPLHTASMLGHLNFVQQLLSWKPELAAELDSRNCSPLHLAAAKGHVDIVREILSADAEVCLVRNSDGRTALHLASIKGRAAVLAELVRFLPESTRVLTDRAETGLHLCVKWNRVEALKVLAEEMMEYCEFLNWKDCEGNSVLHTAVCNKNVEIINYLLTLNVLEVNALNKNGLTALDLLIQSPRDLRDMEIECALRKAGASIVEDLHLITENWFPEKVSQTTKLSSLRSNTERQVQKQKSTDGLSKRKSALMVVASLIATVAFQAGLTPPGGVWQDERNGHLVGQSVMAYRDPKVYRIFMILNTIAFLSSLSIILLLVSWLPINRRRWMWIQTVIMWVAISAQVGTYFVTLRHVASIHVRGTLRKVTLMSVLTWFTLMVVVFIGNVVRLNLWILRKKGYIKEKERRSDSVEDDQEDVFD